MTNQIGEIFDRYNIVEYKSPGDSMTIDVFYKVNGYACLYKVHEQGVNSCKASEITITMVHAGYPREMFRHLQAERFIIENPYPGIYYIKGHVLFVTQVIVTNELERSGQIWIRTLIPEIKQDDYEALTEIASQWHGQEERQLMEAVVSVVSRVNQSRITRWKERDDTMFEVLQEIMQPEIEEMKRKAIKEGHAEGRARGRAEGREEGRAEGRAQGITQGTEEKLISMVAKKLRKGKNIETIAEELEEQPADIRRICDAFEACGEDAEPAEIYEWLKGSEQE